MGNLTPYSDIWLRQRVRQLLEKLDSSIRDHPNFIEHVKESGESWNDYKIHLPEDPDRQVHTGVVAIHFPE